jgi:5S rRNA maturation endonuclease (ribonuclease M5)
MKEKNCTRHEALVDLAQAINYPLKNAGTSGDVLEQRDIQGQIFEASTKYYSMALLKSSKGLAYQSDVRGHSVDTLKAHSVGFSDGGLLAALLKQGFSQENIIRSGLVVPDKKGGYRDYFFPGLYIYPHKDIRGRVCDFTTKDPRKKYKLRLPKDYRKPGASFLNMKAFNGPEIVMVEGEDDLLSICGSGNHAQVVATTGPISEEKIEYLKTWATTGPTKTILLCFDNDPAGRKYTEKIKGVLTHHCYPDKLCEISQKLRIRQKNRLQDDDSEATGDTIPQLTQVVIKVIRFDQRYDDIDDCVKAMTDPEREYKALMGQARRHLAPLAPTLNRVRAWYKACGQKNCNNPLGEIVFDWFFALGGFFVQGEEYRLFYENKIYEIGNKSAFKALLYNVCGLNYADNSAKSILEVVKALAYLHGKHANAMGWIHTDFKKPAIYIDLHNESNAILKIQPGSVELIQNGANDDQVLVVGSPMLAGLNYIPDVDIREAMGKAQKLIFDNLACSDSNRFYILARAMGFILTEFVNARGITKFSGNQGSGKSLGARLLSYLVIGADCVSQGSVASYRSEAVQSPLLLPDNLEQANITNDMMSFLIMAATGAINQKRDSNTSSGNIYEENKTHIITTSIEPFIKSELGSRTIDIHFKPEFRNEDFPGETLLKTQIERVRDEILSAFIHIVAHDVLPTYEQDQARGYQFLNTERRGHAKERLNEVLGCLHLLCRQIVKYIPHGEHSGEDTALMILDDWLIEQDELAMETQQDADPILYRMEALFTECSQLNKEGFVELYGIQSTRVVMSITGDVLEINFIATAKELCTAFSVLSKNKNIPNPFPSPGVLGSRLFNSISVLENAGWEVKTRYKVSRGQYKHLLGKKLV